MKTPPDPPDRSRPDPNDLLATRLRRTTPEFEQRFDALRRRLAEEAPAPSWHRHLPDWGQTLTVGLAAAAMVTLASLFLFRTQAPLGLSPEETAALVEMAALDESLSSALALTDPETLDAILHMPLN